MLSWEFDVWKVRAVPEGRADGVLQNMFTFPRTVFHPCVAVFINVKLSQIKKKTKNPQKLLVGLCLEVVSPTSFCPHEQPRVIVTYIETRTSTGKEQWFLLLSAILQF